MENHTFQERKIYFYGDANVPGYKGIKMTAGSISLFVIRDGGKEETMHVIRKQTLNVSLKPGTEFILVRCYS